MRGRAKANLKDYQGAIIDLTNQITNNFRIWGERDAQSYLERGKAKANLKDYEGAMSDFNKSIKFISLTVFELVVCANAKFAMTNKMNIK